MDFTQTIYKKDSKGKYRFLTVSANEGELIQESGLIDGKSVIHRSMCEGKNIGKSNETSISEQAVLEAKSKIKSKLDEGYFETLDEVDAEKVILPMLAKDFNKESHKVDWTTAYVQPKLDGMRCLKEKQMISRKGKEITTLPHILELDTDGLILDGELYAHGLSFQENMELVKKNRPESINVKYHIYDVVSELPFWERFQQLEKYIGIEYPHVEIVPTYKVDNVEDVQKYHAQFLSEGYEGTMIRWGNESYKINGRSSNLLKYKDFQDIACKVVDVVPSERNPEQGVIQCELNGKIFGCGMKFSHAERKEILNNKSDYIGQIAEVRFFEYSTEGIPRFPVCVGIRLDV